MNYVVFDLEWNGCFSSRLHSHINEIIEFGAVKLNESMEITGRFSCLIRPVISTRLASTVRTLTSLSYEQIKKGVPFEYGLNKFRKFAEGCVLMTWSTTDIDTLVNNLRYHKRLETIPFMKKYVDLQLYCHDMLGLSGKNALGLQTAADILGLDTDNIPHHRALGDSIITAMCLQRLFHRAALESYTENCGSEFYKKLFFRTMTIEKLDSEYTNLRGIFFNCPECGGRARRKGKWKEKFKGFGAPFVCRHCGYEFIGSASIKRKYDSTLISKKVVRYYHPSEELQENTAKNTENGNLPLR